MAISTSIQTSRYYDFFRDKEIVFTKANIKALKMDPRQIYFKCGGSQFPCLINSSSLQMAKILISVTSKAYLLFSKNNKIPVNLRFCFLDASNSPISFFVNCETESVEISKNSSELALVTLNFMQRPPDDLIYRIGEFAETNDNFKKRTEDRILINKDSLKKLGMEKGETTVYVDNVPRRCIFENISFGGANILLVGIPKFLIGKSIRLQFNFIDTEPLFIVGVIKYATFVEGRKDISTVGLAFKSDEVPMEYKLKINNFISLYQKSLLNVTSDDGVTIINPETPKENNLVNETANQVIKQINEQRQLNQ